MEITDVKGDVIKGKLSAGAGAEVAGDETEVMLKIKSKTISESFTLCKLFFNIKIY